MKKYKYKAAITIDGKRYWVYADTKTDLEVKKALKRKELSDSGYTQSGDMLLKTWAYKCIDTYGARQSEQTRKRFVQKMESRVLAPLGNKPLKQIRPIDCQMVMNDLEGYSDNYIRDILQIMRFLFKRAKQNRLIAEDPTEGLTKPKAKASVHRRALTPEERQAVTTVAKRKRSWYIYLLMLHCGLRPSEAAICKGSDITQIDGVYMLHVRGTKNRYSDRFVPIPDEVLSVISSTPQDEYIAVTEKGNPIKEDNRNRNWQGFKYYLQIEMGAKTYRNALVPPLPIGDDLVPYCLRHEFCTNLARLGVDIRIAQKLMGHSDIQMTANVYTNLEKTDLSAVAKVLNSGTLDGTTT